MLPMTSRDDHTIHPKSMPMRECYIPHHTPECVFFSLGLLQLLGTQWLQNTSVSIQNMKQWGVMCPNTTRYVLAGRGNIVTEFPETSYVASFFFLRS